MPKEQFRPENYKSFEDLPKEQKSKFKPVDNGFVRSTAEENPEKAFEQAQRIVLAKTLGMRYEPSETFIETGVKMGQNIKGKIVAGGEGTYVVAIPSHLTLEVEVGGRRHETWVGLDFRKALLVERLSKQLCDAIKDTVPKHVQMDERIGQRGTIYYRVCTDDIIDWAVRARERQVERTRERNATRRSIEKLRQQNEQLHDWRTKADLIELANRLGVKVGLVFEQSRLLKEVYPDLVSRRLDRQGAREFEVTVYAQEHLDYIERAIRDARKTP